MEQDETKLRLLNAAGEVFSEKGFLCGTIREICALAHTNVASVNYHFGGKKELYEALLEHCHREGLRRHPPDAGLKDGAQAEQALGAFIRSFLNRTLGHDGPAWSTRLMAREMADPSPGVARMVASSVRPNFDRLSAIVAALMGGGASDTDIRNCALSVVGQCQHYYRAKGAIGCMFPDMTWDAAGIEFLTNHILRFSLAAIRGYRQEGKHSNEAC
ncbi:CerR family C-terminal domain-containing protein [Fundidesulfovibrio terrae]|uniref:CerR family C-terminal domain-containing protein n=1 Tax=Fundidesulfovibrio terrae TaxID=2922866 RepID=UPI001FAF2E27|nr:CerR family C-terminal domain-containing protein [Fundidesulfovibrio terrae]